MRARDNCPLYTGSVCQCVQAVSSAHRVFAVVGLLCLESLCVFYQPVAPLANDPDGVQYNLVFLTWLLCATKVARN